MRAHQIISNSLYQRISVQLLLVSTMDYTMRILLFPLVLIVNIDYAASATTCLIYIEH
jgi:hypothetical protein